MQYLVQTVADDELPEGMTRVIVEQVEGPPILLINGTAARTWAFLRAWEDTCEPCATPTVLRPGELLRAI